MAKLTEAQYSTLVKVDRNERAPQINSRSGLALCRLGLLECFEMHVVRCDFISHRGRHVQYRSSAARPTVVRDWWITEAGRAALSAAQDREDGR